MLAYSIFGLYFRSDKNPKERNNRPYSGIFYA